MFIFNFKINKNLFSKIFFITLLIIILIIFLFSIYIIFFKHNKDSTISDTIKTDDIFEINETNYTNILRAVHENIDSYIGCKVHIKGYVYRLLDFKDNEFVIARDMLISKDSQTLIVGFLCNYEKASDFEDGTCVELTGEITKGDFNGDIPILNVISINHAQEPENYYVSPPDNTYIPTTALF